MRPMMMTRQLRQTAGLEVRGSSTEAQPSTASTASRLRGIGSSRRKRAAPRPEEVQMSAAEPRASPAGVV